MTTRDFSSTTANLRHSQTKLSFSWSGMFFQNQNRQTMRVYSANPSVRFHSEGRFQCQYLETHIFWGFLACHATHHFFPPHIPWFPWNPGEACAVEPHEVHGEGHHSAEARHGGVEETHRDDGGNEMQHAWRLVARHLSWGWDGSSIILVGWCP